MRVAVCTFLALICLSTVAAGQGKPRPNTKKKAGIAASKNAAASDPELGTVAGHTYSNQKFQFQVKVPDLWLIPDKDFEEYMKSRGFDLRLKAPETLDPAGQAKINRSVKNLKVLLTVYRSMPGTPNNAVMRISVEDLSLNPQINDAVDYLDAVRAELASLRLPVDLRYSQTQAERLGELQFGYIDVSTKAGKKRMYATVREGHAILFTLTYYDDNDLETMRQILTDGNFHYK